MVNLSPRKDLVLKEAFRSLRFGGEFFFSDVYCDRRLPEDVRQHKVLWVRKRKERKKEKRRAHHLIRESALLVPCTSTTLSVCATGDREAKEEKAKVKPLFVFF